MVEQTAGWRELAVLAAGLHRRPGYRDLSDWAPELPDGRTIQLADGRAIFVRDSAGPPQSVPVLLLHGWTWTMDATFFGLYRQLSQRHRLVAFDQRGHGSSSAQVAAHSITDLVDDAIAVLDALGIPQAIVLGYSLGGAVAMQLAHRYPNRVAGISVHGACLHYGQVLRDRLVWPVLAASGRIPRVRAASFATQRMFGGYLGDPEFRLRWPWLSRELSRTSDAAMVSTGAAVRRYDMRGRAREITCPASMLIPRRDPIALPWLQLMAAEELGASVVFVDGDHHVPLACPDRYAAAALEAIEAVTSRL